jgi:hypothetical protein
VTRRITIPRYRALQAHWARHPRPEWLIASYLGFRPIAARRLIVPGEPARAQVPPPTGAMLSLFTSLGGKPGKTVVLST